MSSYFKQHLSAGGKLSLRLSSQTIRVLNYDITCFLDPRERPSLSKLVATILTQFADTADSSVHRCCESRLLRENTPEWKKAQDVLCDKVRALLCRSRKTVKISLNKDICIFSERSMVEQESVVPYAWTAEQRSKAKVRARPGYLYGTFQDYAAALLEEYASLSYGAREQIFYRSFCETLNKAKNAHIALHLTTFSMPDVVFRFWPRPDGALLSDPLLPYNYVVGYSLKESTDGSLTPHYKKERLPASFRLSSIEQLSEAGLSDLNSTECDTLEDAIEEKGVPYLFSKKISKKVWALVCFSKDGASDFRKRLINRPSGTRIPKIETLLTGFPTNAEVWLLKDLDWKMTAYLRSFGASIYLFSFEELTPDMLDTLIDEEVQKLKIGTNQSEKSTETKATQRASVATKLEQTFLYDLKDEILHWHQDALSGMEQWDAWVKVQ